MNVLVPIDGSEPSMRAVRSAAAFAVHYDATLNVIHFRKVDSETATQIPSKARDVPAKKGVDAEPRLEVDPNREFQPGKHVEKRLLELVEENGYDHVIMGHYGVGTVDEAIMWSATKRVSEAGVVPLTIIP